MQVLVTGGSGFIGSHLVDKLIEHDIEVRVFDRVKPHQEDVEWFKGDLLNEREVLEACRDVDVVYHLAAVADVGVAVSHPEECLMINEVGTINLLRSAVAREVEQFILASSTWVYGEAEGIVDESTPIPMPGHVYTKTKVGQEHLVYSWHRHYGLPYTILRYGIPYGPRMRSNMVISIFVRKAMKREPLTIFGDGKQGRCFIYVEDLAEGNVAALKGTRKNEIFNIAGKKFVTLNQVVNNLKQIFGELSVKHETVRPNDFKGAVVSIEKAKKLLGWEPKTQFQVGLRKYLESIKT
jgi:UDP-glucose 4-epimerase